MKKCFSALLIVFLLLWYLPSCRLTEAKETNLDICGVRYQILPLIQTKTCRLPPPPEKDTRSIFPD